MALVRNDRMYEHAGSDEWRALGDAPRRCLELAWITLGAGGLPVGAVIVDDSNALIAEGRNRAYDPPTGADALEANPLAHAEMNALAGLSTDADTARLTLWSTHQPCEMCASAISFVGVPSTIAIAADPSDPGERVDEPLTAPWTILATAMFLLGPMLRFGPTYPMGDANLAYEPEAVELAQRWTVANDPPIVRAPSLGHAVAGIWPELSAAAAVRGDRLG